MRERGQTVWATPRGVGLTPKGNDGDEAKAEGGGTTPSRRLGDGRRRERGQTVWETPRGVGLTPKICDQSLGTATEGKPDHIDTDIDSGARRERGRMDWETPRRVGPTLSGGAQGRTVGGDGTPCYRLDGVEGGGGERRKRGQTVWATPRGVGLTPKAMAVATVTPAAGDRDGDGSSCFQSPRARGQTVWETPRGVGLTPTGWTTPAVSHRKPPSVSSVPTAESGDRKPSDRIGGDGGVSSNGKKPRVRGQTVWETPRGVGLTPGNSTQQTMWDTPAGRSGPGTPSSSPGRSGLRAFAEGH